MSNGISICASSWTIPVEQLPGAATAVVPPTPMGPQLPLFPNDPAGKIVEHLAKLGLGASTEHEGVEIVGRTEAEYSDGQQVRAVLMALAPFSRHGSYVEFDRECDNLPTRWTLHHGKVMELTPRLSWSTPGDLGGYCMDAEAVRAELDEAPEVHGLDEHGAERIAALGDEAIHAVIQAQVRDRHWAMFDDLRSRTITRLAAQLPETVS